MTRRDEGSALVEFVLVSTVLTVLVLAILQLGLAIHTRTLLVAAAAEGARYGARADRGPDDAVVMARQLIIGALPDSYAQDVRASSEPVSGVETVVVEVRATLPVLALLGPPRGLVVRGHAVVEGVG